MRHGIVRLRGERAAWREQAALAARRRLIRGLDVRLLGILRLVISLLGIGRRGRVQTAIGWRGRWLLIGRLAIALLGESRLRVLLLGHHRHRLAGIGIKYVIGLLLARAGANRKRGHYG